MYKTNDVGSFTSFCTLYPKAIFILSNMKNCSTIDDSTLHSWHLWVDVKRYKFSSNSTTL